MISVERENNGVFEGACGRKRRWQADNNLFFRPRKMEILWRKPVLGLADGEGLPFFENVMTKIFSHLLLLLTLTILFVGPSNAQQQTLFGTREGGGTSTSRLAPTPAPAAPPRADKVFSLAGTWRVSWGTREHLTIDERGFVSHGRDNAVGICYRVAEGKYRITRQTGINNADAEWTNFHWILTSGGHLAREDGNGVLMRVNAPAGDSSGVAPSPPPPSPVVPVTPPNAATPLGVATTPPGGATKIITAPETGTEAKYNEMLAKLNADMEKERARVLGRTKAAVEEIVKRYANSQIGMKRAGDLRDAMNAVENGTRLKAYKEWKREDALVKALYNAKIERDKSIFATHAAMSSRYKSSLEKFERQARREGDIVLADLIMNKIEAVTLSGPRYAIVGFWREEASPEKVVVIHEDGVVSYFDGAGSGGWEFLEKGHFKISRDGYFQEYWNNHTWRLSPDGRRLQRYQGAIKFDGMLIRFNP
jgi:vacuolar-type H+-ATPase subunit H